MKRCLILAACFALPSHRVPAEEPNAPRDVEFKAEVDGTAQKYVEIIPKGWNKEKSCDLLFGVTDDSGKSMTPHYGAIAAQTPNETDVQGACRLLGRRLAEWVAVMVDGRKEQHPLNKPESRTLPG